MTILSVSEKEMLVDADSKWQPDVALLMHIASFNDHGAHKDSIGLSARMIRDEGGTPRRVRLIIQIDYEWL